MSDSFLPYIPTDNSQEKGGQKTTGPTFPPNRPRIPTYRKDLTHRLIHKKCGYWTQPMLDLYR